MVVYLKKSIRALLSVFKRKAGAKGNEDQRRLTVLYTASQHYQENVFIEGSRPQYLEDLHTEAQEGLKIQQQEEKNGVNFPDDESIASTDTLQPEQDASPKDRGSSPESGVSTGDSATAVSAVSTRPALTRQGSTFKPPNPAKRLEKGRRRSRRTTIMGIPSQVQRELALHRCSTFQQVTPAQLPNGDGEASDGQTSPVIIPTINGEAPVASQEGARVHLSDVEATREEQLLRHHLHAIYQNEQPVGHQDFGSALFPLSIQRPKSLAVPGMTTSSSSPCTMFTLFQEPQGPVMSISPQATYLSKIIPNAVLPASVDVIQIDRSSSQSRGNNTNHGGGSVRAVSKNSLTSGDSSVSPVLSRKSDGDGSHVENSHNSTPLPISASASNWSQSRSSETIISNTSNISSKESTGSGNPQTVAITGQESQSVPPGGDQVHASLHSSISWVSSPSGKGQGTDSGVSGSAAAGESMKNSQSFIRSLSVMKNKLPPAPPRRTNSLHNNKVRKNSSDPADVKDLPDSVSGEVKASPKDVSSDDKCRLASGDTTPTSVSDSHRPNCLDDSTSSASSTSFTPSQASSSGGAGGSAEPRSESSSSSPQKTPSEGSKFERTMSPSSGYSSQSGTPTLSPKGIPPSSPAKQKKKPVKPERSGSRASSSAASASSSLTSLSSTTSEPVNADASPNSPGPPPQGASPSVAGAEKSIQANSSPATHSVRDLFNIPPPPKVKAPCPPPPETWAHSRRTFELLCRPCPNVSRQAQQQAPPPQMKDSTVKKAETPPAVSKETQGVAEKQRIQEEPALRCPESKGAISQDEPDASSAPPTEGVRQELQGKECPSTEEETRITPERMEANSEVQRQEQGGSPLDKDAKSHETLPKKDPPPIMKKTMLALTERQRQAMCSSVTTKANPPEEPVSSPQAEVKIHVDKSWVEVDSGEATSMQTLSTNASKVSKVSPPPSPPPAYHPTPPPSRKTPPSSVSTPPPEELNDVQEEEAQIAESCWPPPPPPLEGDSVFDGVDEMDFPPPPPPPPFVADSLSDVTDICNSETDDPHMSAVALEEVEVTVNQFTECETGTDGDNVEVPVAPAQTPLEGTRPEEASPGSKEDTIDLDTPCRSSLLEDVPPPPTEPPPPPPVPSMPPSSSCLAAYSGVLLPSPGQIEDQTPPDPPASAPLSPPVSIPSPPPLPADKQAPGVSFRRQPSLTNRDTRSKEHLSRHKSAPIPKEDANIPLVTPSLLQMVRLRSVSMAEDQTKAPTEDRRPANGGVPAEEVCPVSPLGPQKVPQKPIRKSLSIKSPPQTPKTSSVTLNTPSVRLQEAIRMKTAAMSSRDGLPPRVGLRSLANSSIITEPGPPSPMSPEGGDMHKSPASTASFIFSRSTKKVVIETPVASTPETQASLRQSLAAELMQVSDQSKTSTLPIGGVKAVKIPPPVAKKPAHGSTNPLLKTPPCLEKMELDVGANGDIGKVQPAGQNPLPLETRTTTLTSDTIETLF